MAIQQFQTMSGGKGAEVTFEIDDATGALNVQIGNDRGSPLVRVGFELSDGTVYEFEQNERTKRAVEYRFTRPKAALGEVVVEESDEEEFDKEVEGGPPERWRKLQQRFRRKQAIDAADRGKVAIESSAEGEDYLNFKRTWRQEVY